MSNKKVRKFLSFVLVLSLVAVMPVRALAEEWDLGIGNITVNAKEEGQFVSQENGEQDKMDMDPIITADAFSRNTVTISSSDGTTANVTIQDVAIMPWDGSAVTVTDGSNASINISGNVYLSSKDQESAAIHVGDGSSVTITGDEDAYLGIQTDYYLSEDGSMTGFEIQPGSGAGIGSNKGEDMSGNITLTGEMYTNTYVTNGAGIGAGEGGTMSGNVNIESGYIKVQSGSVDENGDIVHSNGVIGTNGGVSTGSITISENAIVNGLSGSEAEKFIDGNTISGSTSGGSSSDVPEAPSGGSSSDVPEAPSGDSSSDAPADTFAEASEPVAAPIISTSSGEYYTIATEFGGWVKHTSETENGVLTVTVDSENAVFSASLAVLKGLQAQGVEKVVFVTASATSSFQLAEAVEALTAGRLVLTHMGATATLTLNGEANSTLLK